MIEKSEDSGIRTFCNSDIVMRRPSKHSLTSISFVRELCYIKIVILINVAGAAPPPPPHHHHHHHHIQVCVRARVLCRAALSPSTTTSQCGLCCSCSRSRCRCRRRRSAFVLTAPTHTHTYIAYIEYIRIHRADACTHTQCEHCCWY